MQPINPLCKKLTLVDSPDCHRPVIEESVRDEGVAGKMLPWKGNQPTHYINIMQPTNPFYKYYATNQPIMQKPFPPIFCSHYAESFYLHKAFPFWSYLWIKILIPNILCTSCKKAIRARDFFKGFTQAAACKLIMQMWPQ